MGVETVSVFKCDSCGEVIEPLKGKIFQGNVYMCDDNILNRGGLIGNCFPSLRQGGDLDEKFSLAEVKEYVFCDKCIKHILMIV